MAENNEKKPGEKKAGGLGGMLDSLRDRISNADESVEEKAQEARERQADSGGMLGNAADQLAAQAREVREDLAEEQRKKEVAEARELRQAREEQRREEQRPRPSATAANRRDDDDDEKPRQGLGGALGNIAGQVGSIANNASTTRGVENAPPQTNPGQHYTVQPGDTLSKIAQRFYGSLDSWRGIYDANRGIIGENPDVIHPGQVLHIPDAPAASAAPAGRTYTVQSGDTLRAIAQRHYGDEMQWNRIFEANRDKISNPDLIQVGWVLRIP